MAGPYREADKPERSFEAIWGDLWCRQRHTEDLRELAKGNLFGLFQDSPELAAAIPDCAQRELNRRGET